jgi:serine/threonine protein kinase
VPQTDIYGLGIVLFEMLTGGERPFTGDHAPVTGSTSEKVRWEQVHLEPISPRRFNPRIAPELEAVVLNCLEKDSVDRYTSALNLFNDFESAVSRGGLIPAGKPVPPPPPIPPIVDDGEATTILEPKPIQPIPYEKPAAPSKKWTWAVVIGIAVIFAGFFIGGAIRGASPTPAPPPLHTTAVVFAPDMEKPTATNTDEPDTPVPDPTAMDEAVEPQPEPPTYTPFPTYTALPSYTKPPPTNTSKPPTPTKILTNTTKPPTATERPTDTPQLEKPYLIADITYFCRQSPTQNSESHCMFNKGDKNLILGRSNNDWWLIAIDDPSTRTKCCWVTAGNPGGDLSIVPIIGFEIDRLNCPPFP